MGLRKDASEKPYLVKHQKTTSSDPPELAFRTGETVQRSGVYAVSHADHRLPPEVTLAGGDVFPPCSACETLVSFQFLRPVNINPGFRIQLFALPILKDESEEISKKAA